MHVGTRTDKILKNCFVNKNLKDITVFNNMLSIMDTNNEFIDIKFIGSFPSIDKMPKSNKPEYAFIGRSNVGKSSLINYLSNRKAIAKTSKKPGKTQMINLFDIRDEWSMVDLPGYGYATITKKKRIAWKKMIYNYLEKRENLMCCFVLLDSRITLQDVDLQFLMWLGEKSVPFSIIFTKIDAVRKGKKEANIDAIKSVLLERWNSLPPDFEVSSVKKIGREELVKYIEELNNSIK